MSVACEGKQNESKDMTHLLRLLLILAVVASLSQPQAQGQGETTSAIVGQVRDATNAVVRGATVAVANLETGLRRSAKTDDAGRFNFPQLKPGTYSVKVEAQGFEPQQNDNVISGLGQKQTVDFTLRVARSKETVEVNSELWMCLRSPEACYRGCHRTARRVRDAPRVDPRR